METSNERSIASLNHLSALSQYFFPFGNYIFPLIIWSLTKDKSKYNDFTGKQVLNFQLSMLLYTLILLVIAVPTFVIWLINMFQQAKFEHNVIEFETLFTTQNITGMILVGCIALMIFCFLKLFEFILIIYASVKSADGEYYKYPLTINFIK